jgi:hypothetical protein
MKIGALLIAAFLTGEPVPILVVEEGLVTGLGSNIDGLNWILVNGKSRHLDPETTLPDLEYGDWVRVACNANNSRCYILEYREGS